LEHLDTLVGRILSASSSSLIVRAIEDQPATAPGGEGRELLRRVIRGAVDVLEWHHPL